MVATICNMVHNLIICSKTIYRPNLSDFRSRPKLKTYFYFHKTLRKRSACINNHTIRVSVELLMECYSHNS